MVLLPVSLPCFSLLKKQPFAAEEMATALTGYLKRMRRGIVKVDQEPIALLVSTLRQLCYPSHYNRADWLFFIVSPVNAHQVERVQSESTSSIIAAAITVDLGSV